MTEYIPIRVGFIFMKGPLYIAKDTASGGYPYCTENPRRVFIWPTLAEALSYYQAFSEQGWRMLELNYQLEDYAVTEEDLK